MHTVMAVLLLTARFYSAAPLPASDRVVATQVAANILRQAGIDILWADCNERLSSHGHAMSQICQTPPSPDEVIVRFVSSPSSNGNGANGATKPGGDSLGDAYVDTAAASGALATVYVDRVGIMSRASGVDAGTLLGRVTAHEIGHLLLGTASHRPGGLMRAEWTTTLLQRRIGNDWRFSKLDAARAREGVLKRGLAVQTRAGDAAPLTTVPCLEPGALLPATCPSCPVCATLLPADRVSLHLLIEPGF
jgi:hypothetical protein